MPVSNLCYNASEPRGCANTLAALTNYERKSFAMADTILYKPCSVCKQELPYTSFCKDKSKTLGIASECRQCRRAKNLLYCPPTPRANAACFTLTGKYRIETLPEKDLAYIAGLFDGEGSIYIGKSYYGPDVGSSHQRRKRTSGVSYRVICAVGMTDQPIIQWLQETTGLGRIDYKQTPSTKKSKPAWYWKTNDGESTVFLLVIKDYLRVKQPQAELGLELLRIKTLSRKGYKHTPERQLEIVREFARLNHRGLVEDEGGGLFQYPT